MPATAIPQVSVPQTWAIQLGTANPNLDGTGTIATLATASTDGSFVTGLRFVAEADTTLGMVRAFLYDGSTYSFYDAWPVSQLMPDATSKSFALQVPIGRLELPSGWSLRVSTENAEVINAFAFGGDYAAENANPRHIYTHKTWPGTLATANTNRDGTGTVVTVVTAGSNGSVIEEIHYVATGVTTAGVVRLFLHDGTNYYLRGEELVAAVTPSIILEVFSKDVPYNDSTVNGIYLPSGWSARFSTHNAEGFAVLCDGGDY